MTKDDEPEQIGHIAHGIDFVTQIVVRLKWVKVLKFDEFAINRVSDSQLTWMLVFSKNMNIAILIKIKFH